MTTPLRTLIIEDSVDDTELAIRTLRRAGYEPTFERVETAAALNTALEQGGWDVIISDYTMPHLSGLEALKLVQQKQIDVPFIILSGSIGEDIAVEAMKAGAHDYIMKDNSARLIPAVARELREARVRRERHLAEQRVHHLAYFDPLTELPNRTQFLETLDLMIDEARNTGQQVALLLLDLNDFREINDTLGYDNGDALLRQAAQRLLTLRRPTDTVARLGGDDFALLLGSCSLGLATDVCQRALSTLNDPYEVAGFTLETGAKIGVALFPDHAKTAHLLLQHADVALSLSKQGSNFCTVYDPVNDPSNPGRLLLMTDLRAAINNNHIQPHFQPKVNMHSGCITGAEALVRWTHPRRGLVPPHDFIALAEKTGMINLLTLHMLDVSMKTCSAWREAGLRIPVAVNLSVKDLLDQMLVRKVEILLASRAMEPNMLEFEITETALMGDPVRALEILTALSDMGIRLHIDDFGTGYSSLGYLKRLPVNAVKIDRSFVHDMTDNPDAAIIVRSTIELAHNLGLKVIAEGVETQATWEQLARYDCDEAQGYLISKPAAGDKVENWVHNSPWKTL